MCKAAVPEDTATAYFAPVYSFNAFSKAGTYSP